MNKPMTEFMRGCEPLLSDPVTRYTLTLEELDVLKMYVQELTAKFLS
jgi:hypothetical protein